ncbi:hypothetical protein J6590_016643 [Homalodisca vitripennis]|nr:hypothetical protein J6590_016643 [Homalodisca vitripennis]
MAAQSVHRGILERKRTNCERMLSTTELQNSVLKFASFLIATKELKLNEDFTANRRKWSYLARVTNICIRNEQRPAASADRPLRKVPGHSPPMEDSGTQKEPRGPRSLSDRKAQCTNRTIVSTSGMLTQQLNLQLWRQVQPNEKYEFNIKIHFNTFGD